MHIARVSDLNAAADALERALDALRPKLVSRGANSIEFSGGLFRAVNGSNLLVSVRTGTIWLRNAGSSLEVAYQLDFTQLLLVVTVAVLLVLGPPVLGASNLNGLESASVLVFAWVWLFGANVVLTLVRFPRWIKRTVAPGAPK